MAFKIQSRAWRWKMSPSNISMTGEWSCGAVAAAVLLISMSLSTERVYVSAKHSWCQLSSEGSANTPQNIKTRQVWNLLLLLWLRLPIISLQPGKIPLAEMLLTWGQMGSTDVNHHPCSLWGCCCSLPPGICTGAVFCEQKQRVPRASPEEEQNGCVEKLPHCPHSSCSFEPQP